MKNKDMGFCLAPHALNFCPCRGRSCACPILGDREGRPYVTRNRHYGFTLIELMVAASILGLIGLAILTTFGSGFHVYERVQAYGGVQADVLLALEEMERDLRNTFSSQLILFEGDDASISFPAIGEEVQMVEEEEKFFPSIQKVSYYLDEDKEEKALIGQRQSYSESMADGGLKGDQGATLVAVSELKFTYYAFDSTEEKYVWKDSWTDEEEGIPAGVKIELTFQDGGREVSLTRTVLIASVRVNDKLLGEEEEEGGGEEDDEAEV